MPDTSTKPAAKKLHLQRSEMSGNRSACRHTSRPSRQLRVVSVQAFADAPEADRCSECQAKYEGMLQRVRAALSRTGAPS